MTIPGIGSGVGLNILPTRQDLSPAAERNNIANSRQTDANTAGTAVSRDGGQQAVNSGARFDPATPGNQLNGNSDDRRNPADIEALRNQFGLQSDNAEAPTNRAVQSFVSVAEFEERDEISTATGIDVFA